MRIFIFVLFISFLAPFNYSFSQDGKVWMYKNEGQWDAAVRYKVDLHHGAMFIENNGFTYAFHNASEVYHGHAGEEHHKEEELNITGHAVKSRFLNAGPVVSIEEHDFSEHYRNYFLGKDASRWKSNIKGRGNVQLKELYTGISMDIVSGDATLKYSFLVQPGISPSVIRMQTNGAEKIYLDPEGNLHTKHSFGEIIETAPVAWTQGADGEKKKVNVRFELNENIITYVFPQGYDNTQLLVIDPSITFSTFTGATADNWGFTATPDKYSNVFGAGIVFDTGYPTTPGVYDPTYNGGAFDIGISKFNASGTTLMYSSYIGGSRVETPHSIICNPNGELYIMGATSSIDFPVTDDAYDRRHRGGTTFTENSLEFTFGSDIFVVRLNEQGNLLLGSTLIGGTGNDGINRGVLAFNYGDQFRGDITLDNQGNVYVISSTTSTNFPVVNPIQASLQGTQSAVVFKMNPALTSLLWSSYYGGSGVTCGNSIQVAPDNTVYIAGGTTSSLSMPSGANLTFSGGRSDGFVARLSLSSSTVLAGSFIGTAQYDQAYFVQLDRNQKVYVLGQTEGSMPITSGKYGIPNSGQFIRKFSPSLSLVEWTTRVGSGSGRAEISPTAFLVSDCYEIYFSGWGGQVNRNNGSAVNSSTRNFPVTTDAFQATTTGNNFYIGVLEPDAQGLKYGTFMGGGNINSSAYNHVDGGTSRFDKSGRIYHAVCASCGGEANGFTTTPGVYGPRNNSRNCNMAVFKFELNPIETVVGSIETTVCFPGPISFTNITSTGNKFFWDFGDNRTSTSLNPTHTYLQPGTYNVKLIVSDSSNCLSADTLTFVVEVKELLGEVESPSLAVCPGEQVQLHARGGTRYSWSPAGLLNDPSSPDPVATITETTDFQVIISNDCDADTLNIRIEVYGSQIEIIADTNICLGDSLLLYATGGQSYEWSPSTYLDDPLIATPLSVPQQSIIYEVKVMTPEGCEVKKTVNVIVSAGPPVPIIDDSVYLCKGLSTTITVGGATRYEWNNIPGVFPLDSNVVTVNPQESTTYYCNFINACANVLDSIYIEVKEAEVRAYQDTIICPGEHAILRAEGAISYIWSPSGSLNSSVLQEVIAKPAVSTNYHVKGTDEYGCVDSAAVWVYLYPTPVVQASEDIYAFIGDEIQLGVTNPEQGVYMWDPAEYISCVVCLYPTGKPDQDMIYTVTYVDTNGCRAKDYVNVYYKPTLYIPNTFTPNGDEHNGVFKVYGGNIGAFRLDIYNRWGEKIYTFHSIHDYWDGSYKGLVCPDGTYVWKARYTNREETEAYELTGHINLLR